MPVSGISRLVCRNLSGRRAFLDVDDIEYSRLKHRACDNSGFCARPQAISLAAPAVLRAAINMQTVERSPEKAGGLIPSPATSKKQLTSKPKPIPFQF